MYYHIRCSLKLFLIMTRHFAGILLIFLKVASCRGQIIVEKEFSSVDSILQNSIQQLLENVESPKNSLVMDLGSNQSNQLTSSVLISFSREKSKTCSICFVTHPDKSVRACKSHFSIIIADSSESFKLQFRRILDRRIQFDGKYLIVLTSGKIQQIKPIFEVLWERLIINVNVLMIAQKSTKAFLFSFLPFNGKSCGDVTPIKINEFDGVTAKWQTEVFFPNKLKNLQQCVINVGTYESPPAVIIPAKPGKNIELIGFESQIVQEISKKLNFSINIIIDPALPKFYANGTCTGLFKRMMKGEVDLTFSFLALHAIRTEYLSATHSYLNDKVIVVVSSVIPYSPMIKLLIPFQLSVWLAFLGVVVVAIVVIRVLQRIKIFESLFGKMIKTPILNLLMAAYGVTQPKLPFKNFPRILTVTFLLFCLILRSGYTGEMFSTMKSNPGIQIDSFDDLVENKFELCVWDDLFYVLSRLDFYDR